MERVSSGVSHGYLPHHQLKWLPWGAGRYFMRGVNEWAERFSSYKAVLISSGLRDAHVSLESRGADRDLCPNPPLFLCFGLLIICFVTL